jgi:hypothetical protein
MKNNNVIRIKNSRHRGGRRRDFVKPQGIRTTNWDLIVTPTSRLTKAERRRGQAA